MKFLAILLTITTILLGGAYWAMLRYQSVRLDELRNSFKINASWNPDVDKFLAWHEKYLFERFVDAQVESMSEDEKIGQVLLVSVQGNSWNDTNANLLSDIHPGGIYLGHGNISSFNGTKDFITKYKENSKLPLFISTDNEGYPIGHIFWSDGNGLIATQGQRFLGINNTYIVSKGYGETNGRELANVGINMNMSPVADISTSGSYIRNRTFSGDVDVVTNLSKAIIEGQNSTGIYSAIKYFPGTGSFAKDPKNQILDSNKSLDELRDIDLKPFIESSQSADFIITSHSKFPLVDSEIVTFSSKFIKEILQTNMKFPGLIMTDDMNVPSLQNMPGKYVKALQAGHDILWIDGDVSKITEARNEIKAAIADGTLDIKMLDNAVRRIIHFKASKGLIVQE